MRLTYDAGLLEQLVFLETRRLAGNGQALLAARYDRQRTKLYAIADEDARETAYFELNLKWFREFSLEDRVLGELNRYPVIRERADTLLIRKAVSKKDEGAELYVRPDARNVVVAFCAERFCQPGFDEFLRHELCHIADMLDSAFAYDPDISLPDAPPAELDLLRERYRVLWDVTIDGRCRHERVQALRRAEFAKAMPGLAPATFDELWNGPRPPHPALVALANQTRVTASNVPGGPCPLCRFPTFDWAATGELTVAQVQRIQQHAPRWQPAHGLCSRCAELYATTPLEQPATLFV
jgi:hypothetical protein